MGALNISRIKVTNLQHNAGVISCLVNGASYSVTMSALTANTLYMIYFVPTTGLVISSNVNSVGPAGAASWFLVGALYTNNVANTFGGFVTITGAPTSDEILCGANSFSISGGTVTKGSIGADTISFRREGIYGIISSIYQQGAGSSAGANPVELLLPGGLVADAGFHVFYTGTADGQTDNGIIIGQMNGWYSTNINAQLYLFDSTHISFKLVLALTTNEIWTGTAFGFSNSMGYRFSNARVKVSGWTNTPLVDL